MIPGQFYQKTMIPCDSSKLWLGVVFGEDPLWDMKQFGAVFGLVLRVFDYVISGEWCLVLVLIAAHCPATKP